MKNLPLLGMKPETDGAFYTVPQAALVLDVSPATIWRWIVAGKLPAFRVGPRRIRIRKEDVEQAIQPARRTATAMDQEAKRPDIFAHYDPVRARQALAESAGALARVDGHRLRADLRAQREQDSPGRPA
jgi:excisionase family DNA binding protein